MVRLLYPPVASMATCSLSVTWRKSGLNHKQVDKYGLITRDHSKTAVQYPRWVAHCKKIYKTNKPTAEQLKACELDALEPSDLQSIITTAIMKYLPPGHVEAVEELQEADCERVRELADNETN